jgi:hypothetical protein
MAFSINRNLALEKQTDLGRWSNADALEQAWDLRAEMAAELIPAGARVLDLGCGGMALRKFLPPQCTYQACDLVARDADTIVCDFNAGAFPTAPAGEADLITLLGVLEYVIDLDGFMAHLQESNCDIVASYCPQDYSTGVDRPSLGWLNNLTLQDLAELFARFGLAIDRADRIDNLQVLMKLRPRAETRQMPACNVAVISYNDIGNFGDRLGYHVVNSVLPPHAQIQHLTFRTLHNATGPYDLVVLGIGNSIFEPVLTDELYAVVDRAKVAVGIFGTQYRDAISRPAMNRLIDRLDTWFARYEEDVLIFGKGKSNVVHVGDLLISQFPMTQGVDDTVLKIGDEILKELPLDRTIQSIQRYKCVVSSRLHPLLCALTSAERVAYIEQRESRAAGVQSGKFRSMFVDVFGRNFPEKKVFQVDRVAVARYKAHVHASLARIGERLAKIAAAL